MGNYSAKRGLCCGHNKVTLIQGGAYEASGPHMDGHPEFCFLLEEFAI